MPKQFVSKKTQGQGKTGDRDSCTEGETEQTATAAAVNKNNNGEKKKKKNLTG